ncbi:isoleucine--tRNA ligase [Sphingorhabdus sp. IMCC26285]|uniref:Isoleucine--tRNA ligase n=1 Tax=Sphingorhabdus profundilacus TaxID=2509718 RepID=A0A6I4M782_9SPHN|nr:isoleucine--tRNA ligase [Sphingorhabdus profundilacus]MVZ98548.1 isoleucine--tRNA ligase [Sphingorhabdus profundilacus]
MTEPVDYRDTVFLPKTDFPMKAGLPQKEPVILARWQEQRLYEELRNRRRGREKFILHDGPPYANGDMHIGHALNHILKDTVVRTQTLLGKDAPYVPGWDCHGLPIEWKVEEQYRKKKLNKDDVDPVEFRAECRAYAQHWVDTQREQLKRLGINGDWDNPYLTMDFQAEATIVSELLKFAESGQLYRGAKPVMWSPVEKTALAEAEVEYEDIVSTQIDVAFEIVESPIPELVGAHAVIWTTTPWTIPVNQALAYGPDVEYRLTQISGLAGHPHPEHTGKSVLVAVELIAQLEQRWACSLQPLIGHVSRTFKGSDLAGTIVRHPMNHLGGFFAKPRPMLAGDFVTTDSGTGLVHMSPDHGEDDFDLCKANGIDPVFAVEGDGKYRADWLWLGGEGSVINPKFNAPDGPICTALREAGGLLAASADYKHSYPHSWRSKAKVIYRCTPQWFVPMDKQLPSRLREGPGEGESDSALAATHPPSAAFGSVRGAELPHSVPASGVGTTLRDTATEAIAATRFIPEKGRNRLSSMVEGRPDWVLSRQRAWGVPITLFVDRKSGQYLNDPAVNARIVAGVRESGVDAWSEDRAQEYLGSDYALADYERVTDILDVWFDSGCTHVFTLESGRWPDLQWPADLYLEGSDQHRGWFQSSLLQSCGTRGRAPYNAVLTHGFTMDQKGMKMSKSLGNTINPLDLMRDSGADILRLWALTVDFTEDHRIGKEILQGVSDQYRKLRNTFRYLLGALEGFSDAEKVAVSDMPELERYILNQLFHLDCNIRTAIGQFDFNGYVRDLTNFCNEDLSRYFFDVRKDCLYCDDPADLKRRSYRTVLDTLFHALVRYASPVLVFTSEEAWQSRFPDEESVHLQELPLASYGLHDPEISQFFQFYNLARQDILEAIEPLRREKIVGSSLEAVVSYSGAALAQELNHIEPLNAELLAELAMVERVDFNNDAITPGLIVVTKTTNHKCGRCWRHLPEVTEDGALCGRCEDVVNG